MADQIASSFMRLSFSLMEADGAKKPQNEKSRVGSMLLATNLAIRQKLKGRDD